VALTESQRTELYEFVKRSSLGEAGADIVMNAIPTIDWNDVATKVDLGLLGAELRDEMGALRDELCGEMGALRDELRGEMGALRGELRGEMGALRGELRGEMGALRGEMTGEMGALRGEMTGLRGDVQLEMSQLENRLQRSIVTWILAAQGLTLAAISVLVTTLAFVLA